MDPSILDWKNRVWERGRQRERELQLNFMKYKRQISFTVHCIVTIYIHSSKIPKLCLENFLKITNWHLKEKKSRYPWNLISFLPFCSLAKNHFSRSELTQQNKIIAPDTTFRFSFPFSCKTTYLIFKFPLLQDHLDVLCPPTFSIPSSWGHLLEWIPQCVQPRYIQTKHVTDLTGVMLFTVFTYTT